MTRHQRAGQRNANTTADSPSLVHKPLAQIITFWRPGSHDWSWAEEYADIMQRPETQTVENRVLTEGWGFIDHISPVLLGGDGRVWDGHHRICLAIKHGLDALMVEETNHTTSGEKQ